MQAEFSGAATIVDGKRTSPAVSNVARIGRAMLLEDEENGFEQVVYYQAGVAAVAGQNWTQTISEAAFGTGVLANIREAYGFLCNNYDYGDEIYITGFSRGAFTARSVAGLIGKVGILTKQGLELFYEAFDYYQTFFDTKKPCPVSEEVSDLNRSVGDTLLRLIRFYLDRNNKILLPRYQPQTEN